MFVRWDEQRVERDQRLPGIDDSPVLRTFDAPEAMGINFHEVRARSALNHVPGGGFGFSWTVNPYRGCTHACVFCLAGRTAILMADGKTRPLADLKVGDQICGTRLDGSERRSQPTRVLAHWSTEKPGYRVTLEDGTELIASAEHRFLSDRGWKHVTEAERGEAQRPHLTPADKLIGVSAAAASGGAVGTAGQQQAGRGVVSIEPLGHPVPMFDISTGTGDFIANGVISHNCFARKTHTYLELDAGRDFEREIVVKVNVPEVLRVELSRPSWKRELVALGTNTDPYQWVESRYRMMPAILTALEEARTPVSVLTKSPLLLRDIEIYERMARRLPISVNLSVPTLEEKAWRATEPHTPSPAARLDAVAELRRRGIDSGVLIAPLMPGINDTPEQVQPIIERAREAGASFLGGVSLHLQSDVREVFFAWLQEKRPDLIPRYERLYAQGRNLPAPERARLGGLVAGWGRNRFRGSRARAQAKAASGEEAALGSRDPASVQPRLF